MDAGITNNDMGYGTQIDKLGMQKMTLQNDNLRQDSIIKKICIDLAYSASGYDQAGILNIYVE